MAVFTAAAGIVSKVAAFLIAPGIVGGAILKTVVGIGLNKLAIKLSGKKAEGPTFSVNGQLQRGADLPQTYILGRAATAGSLAYANTWGQAGKTPNAFLAMAITLGDTPIQHIDAVWVNGERGTIANVPHETFGHPIPEFHRDGSDYVWVKPFVGDQEHASPYLINDVSSDERPWDATAIGKDTAYVVITFKVNQELFSGFPQVLFEVKGMPLYDPSRDSSVGGDGPHRWDDRSTWGGDGDHLPAVQIYNLMRGVSVGGQWLHGMQATSPAQLPVDHWIEQINKCRAPIAGDSGPEPTYRSGGEISVGASTAEAIEALLDACQGRLSEAGGVYKLFVGAPGEPVATFTDADILSTEEQSFTPFFGLADTVNGISGKFPDPEQTWQVETAPPLLRDDLEAEDGKRRLMADVQFDLVPYPEQVQRLMLGALNEARRARRHTFTLPPKFWALEPGDVIAWTSERNGYDAKRFRVDGVLDQPNADVVVDLTEVDPADYDFNTNVDFTPLTPSISGGATVPIQLITGWSAEPWAVRDASGNKKAAAIRVHWDGDQDDVVAVRVQVRTDAQDELILDGRHEDVAAAAGVVHQGILPETTYKVRGKYVPGTSRPTEWSDWLTVTTWDVDNLPNAIWDEIAAQAQSAFDRYTAGFDFAFDRLAEYDISSRATQVLEDARVEGVVEEKTEILTAKIDGVEATMQSDYVTAVTMTSALSQTSQTLSTQIGNVQSSVTQTATSLSSLEDAFAAFQLQVNSDFNGITADIDQNYYTIAESDAAIAAATSTFTTQVNGLTTTVQTVSSSVNGMQGIHGVRINNNGAISGYGLVSDLVDGTATSDFIVDADAFRVGKSNNLGQYTSPFQVIGGITYILDAMIRNASIDNLKIAGEAVDTSKLAGNAATAFYSSLGGGGNKQVYVQNTTGVAIDLLVWANVRISDSNPNGDATAGVRIYAATSSGGTNNQLTYLYDYDPNGAAKLVGTASGVETLPAGAGRYIRAVAVGDNSQLIDLIILQRHK